MAGFSRSNKELWVLISGISVLKSEELVGTELQRSTQKLLDGLLYYKKPDPKSAEKLKKEKNIEGSLLEFIQKLSKFLELDELQCYDIFCSYLLYEYRGSQTNLQNQLISDRHVQGLMIKLWNYYQSERLFLLVCMKHLLSHWTDEKHSYFNLYKEFIEHINENKDIIGKAIKQFELITTAPVPNKDSHGPLMSEAQIHKWATYNLKEQCELLQIMLLYYKDLTGTLEQFCNIVSLFQKHGFGRRQSFKYLLDNIDEVLFQSVSYLEALIIIENMELEWLYQNKDVHDRPEEILFLKNEESWKQIDDLICNLVVVPEHCPVLLGWMIVRYLVLPSSELTLTKKLGNAVVQKGVFPYLQQMLHHPLFTGPSVIANLGHTIIYGLISTLLTLFEEDAFGGFEVLQKIVELLLPYINIAQDVWEKGLQEGVGSLVNSSMEVFPLHFSPLIRTVTALASAGQNEAGKVVDLVQRLPYFTEYVDCINPSTRLIPAEEDNTWQLATPHSPYNTETFVIPRGTHGAFLPHLEKHNRQAIQWETVISGWQICLCETHNLLQLMSQGAGQVSQEVIQKVFDIAHLIKCILTSDVLLTDKFTHIIDVLHAILLKFSVVPNPPTDLLAECLGIEACIALTKPVDIWNALSQGGILPFLTKISPDVSKLASGIDLNVGILGNLVAFHECASGSYPLLLAFLKLLDNSVQSMSEKSESCFIACELFMLREVFPFFYKWRYQFLSDRDKIGQTCLNIIHKLLTILNQDLKRPLSQNVCVHSLLYSEAGQALLLIISTGEDNVQAALEQQTSCLAGAGTELVQLIKLALSVLNRLLLLKPRPSNPEDAFSQPSPVEHTLCSQPVHLAQPHIVLTVAHYGFHQQDPTLARLAVKLLRRFAKELSISLLACLGNDADTIRDLYLARLESATEDVNLKVALLEFLTVCVAAQPGLLEMFINVPVRGETKELTKDQPSCLQSVMEIIKERKQGAHTCPPVLHCAAVEFLFALWLGWRNVAIRLLKQNTSFWSLLCNPLLKDDITSSTNRIATYIMKILALEFYHGTLTSSEKSDEELQAVIKKLSNGSYIMNWSKMVQQCLQEASSKLNLMNNNNTTLDGGTDDLKDTVLLVTGWRELLTVIAKRKTFPLTSTQKASLMMDLLDSLYNQSLNPVSPLILTHLSEFTSTLFNIWKVDCIENWENWIDQTGNILNSFIVNQDTVPLRAMVAFLSFAALFLQLLNTEKRKFDHSSLSDWVQNICILIKVSTVNKQQILNLSKSSVKYQLPIISISLLKEVVTFLECGSLWLPTLQHHSTIPCLLSTLSICMQVQKGAEIISAILVFFLTLAMIPEGAEVLTSNDLIQHICLPLSATYVNLSEQETSSGVITIQRKDTVPWRDIFQMSVKLMTSMLKSQRHFFFEDALNFVGVHLERMLMSLLQIQVSLSTEDLDAALVTLNFTNHLSVYKQSWRSTHQASLNNMLGAVGHVCQSSIAFLMRPNFIQHLLQHHIRSEGNLLLEEERQRIRRLSSTEDVEKPSPQLLLIQTKLLQIIATSLSILRHFTPDLCEILSDQSVDISQWEPVLDRGFSTPAIDQDTPISLGSMVSCVNVCLRILTKNERAPSPGRVQVCEPSPQMDRQWLLFVLENSLGLLLSQYVLYLFNPALSARDKQMIKRELGSELNSFAMSMARYLRRGTSAHSPASSTPLVSPSQSRGPVPPGNQPFIRLVTTLVDRLFK